ncbi:MAG TPA: metallophosphoesterase [Anaeromyxobacteraceae bacterium]
MRLGHLSDLHIADRRRYPRNGLTGKDCDKHSSRFGRQLLLALREAQLDHLVVTGDLTASGETSEFERVADLLRPWAEKGRLTAVPGNHDVWTKDAAEKGRFLRLVGPDGRGMKRPAAPYPLAVPLSPEVALVALDSARWGEDPWRTPGRLGPQQLQATRDLVRQHAKEGRVVLLALHHHLVLPPERIPSDALVARMPLADADKVVRLVAEMPVAAVLHGHRHCAFRLELPAPSGTTPVLCAGSATRVADEPVRRARAFVYEVDRGGLRGVETLVASLE